MRRIGRQSRDRLAVATNALAWGACVVTPFVLVCLPRALRAQDAPVVRGVVVVEGTASGLAGALVRAVGERGETSALTVTDGAGRFRLTAPTVPSLRLRVEAIGHTSTEIALPDPGEEARVVVPARRTDLTAVDATGAATRCAGRTATAQARAIWAEIRKALEVDAWARAEHIHAYDVYQYERRVGEGGRIDQERGRRLENLPTSPARTLPPSQLNASGYARSTPRGEILHAPNGDVLLSEEFAANHCFRVVAEGDGGRVGLAFEPLGTTPKVEIRGVMWVDRPTAELRVVDYEYTGLTDDASRRPSGGLEFRRLADGLWTVGQWWLHSPLPRDAGRALRVEGAHVVRVVHRDGTVLRVMGRAHLMGIVRDSTQRVAADLRVRLLGTDFEATTNADGRFLIPDLPPGRFRLAVAPPDVAESELGWQDVWLSGNQTTQIELRLDRIGAPPRAASEPSSVDSVRWVLRSIGIRTTERVDSLIESSLNTTERGRLLGRVFDRSSGRAIAGAEVSLHRTDQMAVARNDGRFALGDVPSGQYVMQTRMLGYASRTDTVTIPPGLVIEAEIALTNQPIALDPITVNVHSRWLDSNGFFERRMSGLKGAFYTRRDIEEKKPATFTDLLRDIPAVNMVSDEVGKMAVRFRRVTTIVGPDAADEGNRGCTPAVYYDGIPLNTGFDRLHNIHVPFIDGVEVYVGAATPIEYKHPCGVILIWTRRPR